MPPDTAPVLSRPGARLLAPLMVRLPPTAKPAWPSILFDDDEYFDTAPLPLSLAALLPHPATVPTHLLMSHITVP